MDAPRVVLSHEFPPETTGTLDDLAATTRKLVAACDCRAGCPACVQSPHCGNANDPLDKGLALTLLESLLGS